VKEEKEQGLERVLRPDLLMGFSKASSQVWYEDAGFEERDGYLEALSQ
jgi:hypothetical protein